MHFVGDLITVLIPNEDYILLNELIFSSMILIFYLSQIHNKVNVFSYSLINLITYLFKDYHKIRENSYQKLKRSL